MKTTPEIRGVKARAIVVPLKRPLKNAFGVFEAAPLVLIDVATDQGFTGRSYIFAYATMTQKPLVHLIEQIGRDLAGRAIAPFDLMAMLDAKFRLLGWQGLVGMAVSGLDMAFWDALGQAAGKGVVEMLAGAGFSRHQDQGRRRRCGQGRTRRQGRPHVARPRRGADAGFQPVARSRRGHTPHRAPCAL